jgi:hypothetical protein
MVENFLMGKERRELRCWTPILNDAKDQARTEHKGEIIS